MLYRALDKEHSRQSYPQFLALLSGAKSVSISSFYNSHRIERSLVDALGISLAPCLQEGQSIAQLQSVELDKGASKWKHAIIFYVIGQTPTLTAVSQAETENLIC